MENVCKKCEKLRDIYELNFLRWTFRIHCQAVLAWLIAALAAERITTTVIHGTHLGAAHDVPRE